MFRAAALACLAPLSLANPARAQSEDWRVGTHVDDLVGTKTTIIYTMAYEIDGLRAGAHGSTEAMQLGIFCSAGRTVIAVNTNGPRLMRFGEAVETYRLDEGQPVREQNWTRINEAQTNLEGPGAAELVEQMKAADRLVIRLHQGTRWSDGAFNIAGLDTARSSYARNAGSDKLRGCRFLSYLNARAIGLGRSEPCPLTF